MTDKVWDILTGPISTEDLPDLEEVPENMNFFLVGRIETNGKMEDTNLWFESLDQAYKVQKYFKGNIGPLEIRDMYEGYIMQLDYWVKKSITWGFIMEYEVTINILVDKDANFLEISGSNCHVIKGLMEDALYDIDDIVINKCEVLINEQDSDRR